MLHILTYLTKSLVDEDLLITNGPGAYTKWSDRLPEIKFWLTADILVKCKYSEWNQHHNHIFGQNLKFAEHTYELAIWRSRVQAPCRPLLLKHVCWCFFGRAVQSAGLMPWKYRSTKNNIVVTLHTHCAYPLAEKNDNLDIYQVAASSPNKIIYLWTWPPNFV